MGALENAVRESETFESLLALYAEQIEKSRQLSTRLIEVSGMLSDQKRTIERSVDGTKKLASEQLIVLNILESHLADERARAEKAEARLAALTRTVMSGGIIMDTKGGKNFNCGFYCETTIEDLADAIIEKESRSDGE